MILRMERRFRAQRDDAAIRHFGDRKSRVRAADIDRDDLFAHDSPLPACGGLFDGPNVA